MMWLLLLSACQIGGNNPPRFQTFNDIDVKYLFGIAYIPPTVELTARRGERIDWDINVRDADGDSIELLFPSAPATVHFEADSRTGYWQVPDDPILDYAGFQIVAVDERGASDVLFVNYIIEDFVYDTGDWLTYFDTRLYGDVNVENGWTGAIHFHTDLTDCTWTWPETTGQASTPCPHCVKSWAVRLGRGAPSSGDCEGFTEILEDLETLDIGWSPEAIIDGVTYPNPVFMYNDLEGWLPNGRGSVQGNLFSFEIDL